MLYYFARQSLNISFALGKYILIVVKACDWIVFFFFGHSLCYGDLLVVNVFAMMHLLYVFVGLHSLIFVLASLFFVSSSSGSLFSSFCIASLLFPTSCTGFWFFPTLYSLSCAFSWSQYIVRMSLLVGIFIHNKGMCITTVKLFMIEGPIRRTREGGSEWEPIKFFSKEMKTPKRWTRLPTHVSDSLPKLAKLT
jgi:hypothetical protein